MTAMRERIMKTKLYRIVLWLILFSMAGGSILFSPLLFRGQKTTPAIVTVNGEDITNKEFEQKLMHEAERFALLRQQYGQQADMLFKMLGLENPRELALQTLIYEELVNQVADQLHLELSSEFVMQKLNDPAVLFNELRDIMPLQVLDERGVINMNALESVLQRRGQTIADFEKSLENALRRKMVTDLASITAYASPQECKDYFITHYLKHDYQALELPLKNYVEKAKAQGATTDELQSFFAQQNKESKRYWIPEKRAGVYWRFDPEQFGIAINNNEIEAYYNKHKMKQFLKTPARISVRRILLKTDEQTNQAKLKEQAQKIHQEATNDPQKFAELAQQYSADTQTKKDGGLIDYFSRGQKDPTFERMAFRLKGDGDISPLFTTQDGIEIIQRVDRKPPVFKPLDEVRHEITQQLRRQNFKQQFTKEAQKIVDALKNDEPAFNRFVQQKQGEKHEISLQPIEQGKRIQQLFKTKKGNWSVFIDEDGAGIILNVNDLQKSHEPKFQHVKEDVENDFYQQRAQTLLKQELEQAKKVAQKKNLAHVKEQFGGEIIEIGMIKKDDTHTINTLQEKGVPTTELLFSGPTKPGTVTIADTSDAGYLARLNTVEPFDQALFDEKKAEIKKDLYQEKKDVVTKGFIASLFKNATINVMQDRQASRPLQDDIF